MSNEPRVEPDFRVLFESAPGMCMVLDRDLHIVAATDAYLQATFARREDIVGGYVFDLFPDNPDDPNADAVRNLRASFSRVLQDRATDVMAVQRHDVRKPGPEGGGFEARYWSPINSPILNPDGSVAYIVHRVENVTDSVLLKQQGAEQDETTDALHERSLQMEALRRSERLYRAIGESIDYGVWVCAPDGRNVYASESFLKLVGQTQEQCSDFGWGDVLHADDAERTIAAWQECVRTGGTWNIEHRYRGVDGRWHPILARGVPVRDEQGQITCWAGINLDISDLKQAEEALRESENRLQFALATSHTGAWDLDLADQTAYRSPGHDRIFGYEDLLPQWTYRMFLEHVLPEDRAEVDAKYQHAVNTQSDWSFECRIRRADGEVRWIWAAGRHRHDATGAVRRMAGIVQDVTERRQAVEALQESEERFRTMADAIPQLAWMAEPDGFIFWYNQRWYAYTGTTPEQMEGWGWQSVHDPELLPKVLEQWRTSIATGEPFNMEFPLLGADGRFRVFLTRGIPIKDSDGRVLRWLGTNTDVSEAREVEAHKHEFYRRTILAATEGKLLISERREIDETAGPAMASWNMNSLDAISSAIGEAGQMARDAGMEEQRAYDFVGCITEAAANVVKHAGSGTMSLHAAGGTLISVLSDGGPGITALALPDVALTKGYSTAGTLGMGYKVMIHFADRVSLATGAEGTTVAIEMSLRERPVSPQASVLARLNGWNDVPAQ